MARPLRQAVLSGVAGYRGGGEQYVTPDDRGDPAAARRLLAEAGFPAGLSLRLGYPIISSLPLAAQALQASLARAGFQVHLQPYTQADFWGRLLVNPENARRGEWDLALTNWVPDWFGENNGRTVIEPLFDGRHFGQNTQNYGGYQNRAVNAAIDRAVTAPATALAERAWRNAAQLLMDDVALVPLSEFKSAWGRSQRLRNCTWAVMGLNCDLSSVWLTNAKPEARASR